MQGPIAIIGVGCRLPGGVEDLNDFWRLVVGAEVPITRVPAERWASDRFHDRDPGVAGRTHVDRGHFLRGSIFDFDAAFFGISPREAETLDPQQRLLLEVSWEALEDAGLPADRLRGSATGVYVGGFTLDSMILRFSDPEAIDTHTATSSSMTLLSNRISHAFDLRGPSVTVDTACSSSLVALHLACTALGQGECEVALVGGVNVIALPNYQIVMSKGHFLGADGRSKAFEAGADGYGRGEGAAVVVLRPLAAAVAAGDRILAVIEATAVNQDGQTPGIAQPSGEAQRALIAAACQRGGVDPRAIRYVEAHGTGTRVGDPTEVAALAAHYGDPAAPRAIGSIKANVGHLEAAAGVAGLLKACLVVGRRTIPPHVLRGPLNPAIPWADHGLRVPTAAEAWPDEAVARAAVNSFGYGGTNAHAIVREASPGERCAATPPREEPRGERWRPPLVPISARSEAALRERAGLLAGLLRSPSAPDLASVGRTLWLHRSHESERAAVVAGDRAGLIAALEAVAAGRAVDAAVVGRGGGAGPVLVFTGMGPQWWAMGAELHAAAPAFREAMARANAAVIAAGGEDVLKDMFLPRERSRMHRNDVAQPANFVLQVGIFALLCDLGVRPRAILGHSTGEMAAAYAAGALDLADAAAIVHHRARLQQRVAGGGMIAVGAGEAAVSEILAGIEGVEVAAVNSDALVSLAGSRAALAAAAARLDAAGVSSRPVRVEVAYHSAAMEPIGAELRAALAGIRPRAPVVPLYSTVTGTAVTGAIHDAEYWWQNTRRPVRLADAVRAALADGHSIFVEVGPHPVLGDAIGQVARAARREVVCSATLVRERAETATIGRALATTYAAGGDVDRARLAPPGGGRCELPRYPWQRRRAWREGSGTSRRRLDADVHPLLGAGVEGPTPTWEQRLDRSGLAWLRDHRVGGRPILPGAAFLEAAIAAARAGGEGDSVVLRDLAFTRLLALDGDAPLRLRTSLGEDGALTIGSRRGEEAWVENARARVDARSRYAAPAAGRGAAAGGAEVDVGALYDVLAGLGLDYGPEFRAIVGLRRDGRRVVADLRVDPERAGDYLAHPALVDGAFQALLGAVEDEGAEPARMLPVAIERLRWVGALGAAARCVAEVRERGEEHLIADLTLVDAEGRPALLIQGLACRRVDAAEPPRALIHRARWEPCAPAGAPPAIAVVGDGPVADAVFTALAGAGAADLTRAPSLAATSGPAERVLLWVDAGGDSPDGVDRVGRLVAALQGAEARGRLVVLTRGAAAVGEDDRVDPAAAALAGLARVIMTEETGWKARLIDAPAGGAIDGEALLAGLGDPTEEEMALRGARWFARRLVRAAEADAEPSTARARPAAAPFEIVVERPRHLESVRAIDLRRRPPAAGEVEVEVEHAALNFKDLMKAMGMLSDTALSRTYLGRGLGMEAAGRVVRVGEGVRDLAVGDRVFLYHGGTLRSHVCVDARFAVPADFEGGPRVSASLFVFLTAWHALVTVGRIAAGERVLIHSAAGGVGLAALQIARLHGATVLATAGTEEKREYLRGLGVEHVFDSRTLDFEDEVRAATGGEGVDVVLNSLAGPFLERSLALVAPGGRFLELGKQDIAADRRLGLLPFNRSITFAAIDLDRLANERPSFFAPLARAVIERLRRGELQPLPITAFPASRASEAFRMLASGGLIGKAVIDMAPAPTQRAAAPPLRGGIRGDVTYLITGGVGGFGLASATWLVRQGARDIVVASRRGSAEGAERAAIEAMRRAGAAVEVRALDVADGGAVRALIAELAARPRPLAGIFHAAAILDDAPLARLTPAALRRSFAAKARGAWNLHEATVGLGVELDLFVLFSSISAALGNPGQGAYAAANGFLQGLAARRRQEGLAAVAVDWGAIGEVGMVARDRGVELHLRSLGLTPVTPARALDALGAALAARDDDAVIAAIAWRTWARANPGASWCRLARLLGGDEAASEGGAPRGLDPEARRSWIGDRLHAAAAAVLRMDPADLDRQRPIKDHGLDSLVAVEMAAALGAAVGCEFSAMELLAGRSIAALVERVMMAGEGASSMSAPAGAASAGAAGAGHDEAGHDEAEELLARIDVSRPYFALRQLRSAGGEVHGAATPVPASAAEVGLASAEAGRHMAILGSCAAARLRQDSTRYAFPVRRAELVLHPAAEDHAGGPLQMCARATAAGPSAASATIRASNAKGEVLADLAVEYHALPVELLRELHRAHRRPAPPVVGDPYAATLTVAWRRVGDEVEGELEQVPLEFCAGHFDGLPALPVAILGRLVVEGVAVRIGAPCRLRRAQIVAERFAFAGARLRLRVAAAGDGHRVTIADDAGELARFDVWLRDGGNAEAR